VETLIIGGDNMTKNHSGKDKPEDYKRFSNTEKGYNFSNEPVGNAIPQSEKESNNKNK
jgi:hypothetical protein